MDPLDFLAVASALKDSAHERETRTSVGRSYYAVFNHFRLRLDPLKSIPTTAEAHAVVTWYLSRANHNDLRSVAQTLRDLRDTRNLADYDMSVTVDSAQSKLSFLKADKAMQKSKAITPGAFKALIDALPRCSL